MSCPALANSASTRRVSCSNVASRLTNVAMLSSSLIAALSLILCSSLALIDADHFAEQPGLAHALGKRAANKTQTDNHQTTYYRLHTVHRHHINHEQEPWPAPQANGYFPQANQ